MISVKRIMMGMDETEKLVENELFSEDNIEDEFDEEKMSKEYSKFMFREYTIPEYCLEIEGTLPVLKKERDLNVGYNRVFSLDEIIHISIDDLEYHKYFAEHMYVILLDLNNNIIGISEISQGTYSETLTPIREIIITVLLSGASRFYLLHNHPSNINYLSDNDKNVVNQIKMSTMFLGVEFLDSVVITPNEEYTSYLLEMEE